MGRRFFWDSRVRCVFLFRSCSLPPTCRVFWHLPLISVDDQGWPERIGFPRAASILLTLIVSMLKGLGAALPPDWKGLYCPGALLLVGW